MCASITLYLRSSRWNQSLDSSSAPGLRKRDGSIDLPTNDKAGLLRQAVQRAINQTGYQKWRNQKKASFIKLAAMLFSSAATVLLGRLWASVQERRVCIFRFGYIADRARTVLQLSVVLGRTWNRSGPFSGTESRPRVLLSRIGFESFGWAQARQLPPKISRDLGRPEHRMGWEQTERKDLRRPKVTVDPTRIIALRRAGSSWSEISQ